MRYFPVRSGVLTILLVLVGYVGHAQFYVGADLSYVNEMEDCGESYFENGVQKDPYEIFADHNCNLVRIRAWHTPSWYDDLNDGRRYSDFQDNVKSIRRAHEQGSQCADGQDL